MKKIILTSLLLIFCGSTLLAQNKRTKKADKHFDRLEYVKAAQEYEKLIDKGKDNSPYVYKRLGDSYFKLGDNKNAQSNYKHYLNDADADSVDPEYYYRYAQLLKTGEKYDESNEYMELFAKNSSNDRRAEEFRNAPDYLNRLNDAEEKYRIEDLELNSPAQDFGAYQKEDKLYFVSARDKKGKKYAWNGQPTLDIYQATIEAAGFTDIKRVKGDVNSQYNEGSVAITKDGETMYFTRNDYTNKKYRKSEDGVGQLKIYSAKMVDGKWTDVQELPFNDSDFSTAHVALSPDNETLYFSSDRPGGYGQSDLYKVEIKENDSFGEPVNLGPEINTPGKENFPFIDSEGNLYFSSDGQLGLGGLDVFKAEKRGDSFASPVNMGKPINSSADDFAYSYDLGTKMGYLSTNRSGIPEDGKIPDDDIYRVIKLQRISIYVKVIDSETGMNISEAEVTVYDADGQSSDNKLTSTDGTASFDLEGGDATYSLQASAEEYNPKSVDVPHQEEGRIDVEIELDPIKKKIKEEEIVLNEIHFDFDKSDITKEGAMELDNLVAIMKKHPEMKIHVIAHTDSRGSEVYNQSLSERRAKSTVKYVIDNGIDSDRIDGEGVGESKPKIKCGTDCTEEQYKENRRSEFRIIKD